MLRLLPFALLLAGSLVLVPLSIERPALLWAALPLCLLSLLGIWDLVQTRHSLFRLYPVIGHIRPMLESVRTQVRQYYIESDTDGMPFSREKRSLVYQRAKDEVDESPFGTELSVVSEGYEWLNHSIAPRPKSKDGFRTLIGERDSAQAYSASLLNISAMSYGSLGRQAIRSLNLGAKLGGFAHDTGEGGLTPYHLEAGGDIIWEIGTGYFGCRTRDGGFDPEQFRDKAAEPSVKMIEVKLSQGAKPGHGGILPGRKVTREIAEIRGVTVGEDCISPPWHTAFSTPRGLLEFLEQLRSLSGGKPVGFKLCIGHRWEFLGICKAMLDSDLRPDFIVVDGKEGGTGAAPLEFSDHVGTPLREGLLFVHNALTACGLRERIRVGASGKVVSAFDIAAAMALGADWCNAARAFMFSLGCLQSQKCHTNDCPVGVATQDPHRQRAIVVEDKAERVRLYHDQTLDALAEIVGAMGLDHPSEIRPDHLHRRVSDTEVLAFDQVYDYLSAGSLLDGTATGRMAEEWALAEADSFAPSRRKVAEIRPGS